jgi:hypothetical protein
MMLRLIPDRITEQSGMSLTTGTNLYVCATFRTHRRRQAMHASPQGSLHHQANPESHLPGAKQLEATELVEAFGVRVPDDVECLGPGGSCGRDTLFDQCTTDAPTPNVGVDEERIQLGIAIVVRKDGREPANFPRDLRDINAAVPDLIKW